MRHFLTAVLAALEATLVSLAGIVFIAIPTLLVGIVTMSLQVEFTTLVHITTGAWVLAHNGPLGFVVSPEAALTLGLPAEALVFEVGLAPLAIAGFTAWCAWRIGRRHTQLGGAAAWSVTGAAIGFVLTTALVVTVAAPLIARPPIATVAMVACWFLVPLLTSYLWGNRYEFTPLWYRLKKSLPMPVQSLPWEHYAPQVARLTGMLIGMLTALTALTFALALILGFVDVVSLTQSLQLTVIGVLTFFLAQLAYLPTLLLWSLAWLTGAGFSFGSGSSVTPFDTLLGPLPSIPVLAAIPNAEGSFGAIAPLCIVLVGVLAAVAMFGVTSQRSSSLTGALVVACTATILVGSVSLGLFALATGPIGPGRLAEVGPDPLVSAGLVSAEIGAGLLGGILLTRVGAYVMARERPSEPPHDVVVEAPAPSPPPSDDEGDEGADEQHTQPNPRIADPSDTGEQSWFRKRLKPRTPKQPGPSFDADALEEEYAWKPPADR